MAAYSSMDGTEVETSGSKRPSENGKVTDNPKEDIHSRFGLNVGLSELLHNLSFANLGAFRRKSSKTGTPSPSNQSPQKQVNASKTSPDAEHIELVQLSNIKVSDALWKNIHSKIRMPGDVFLSNMPMMVTSKPLMQKLEAKQRAYDVDERAGTQETKLKNSTKLVWSAEEAKEEERGIGHDFSPSESCYPTWCDKCGDLLWGLYDNSYVRCRHCHYTCHPHCRNLVTLDCRGQNDGETESSTSSDTELETVEDAVGLEEIADPSAEPLLQDFSEEDVGTSLEVSRERLRYLIAEYNSLHSTGLDMTLEEDGTTFRGFIRVHMNLCRPISVEAGTRPPSTYDILEDDEKYSNSQDLDGPPKDLTSFYLPRDTIKALHITSETTTHEMIRILLKKFRVIDNPHKFALYERYYEHGETAKVKMRRIGENEKPLVLALRWSREKNCNKMFVLQENDTGDILWEAFTLPELNNFLHILDREEEEYKNAVREKYRVMGRKIKEILAQRQLERRRQESKELAGNKKKDLDHHDGS